VTWILALLLVAAVGCAAPPPAPEPDGINPLAYEIEAPHGARALLFGSVHVARDAAWELPRSIQQELSRAELLVLEIDLSKTTDAEMLQIMLGLGVMPPGKHLRQVVSRETWQLLSQRTAEQGLPLEALDALKPWVVALQFVSLSLVDAGFQAEHGVERGLVSTTQQLPIRGLETPYEQLSIFDNLPYPVQDRMLLEARRPSEDQAPELDALLDAWRRGDARAMEAILFQDRDDPQLARFYEETYDRRNLRMAESLDEILSEGQRAFVVVGAGHQDGRRGLPSVLREAGNRVRQVSGTRASE
jgi:uncharacterized protein YbaP (TraB family)